MKLDEIERLCLEATPGPWKIWGMDVLCDPIGNSDLNDGKLIAKTFDPYRGERTYNTHFIAASRTLMPKLLEVAKQAKQLIQRHEHCFTFDPADLEDALVELERL